MERDEVLQRLRAWTADEDPVSGEPLPLAHVLRHRDVHATLVAALRLLETGPAPGNRPRNAGRAWNDADDAKLVALFDAGSGISRLADEMERTRGSITARLVKLGKIEPPAGLRLRH
jgi:hypothetical protein